MTSVVTGGCGFVGRHLTRRHLEMGHDVWIIDDLSTGLHPDQWLGGASQAGAAGGAVKYRFGARIVTFVHEDLSVTMLKQLGTIKGEKANFPSSGFVFALASVVGGRATIEGDPMHVAADLGIDALFFLWLVRNAKKVGKVL